MKQHTLTKKQTHTFHLENFGCQMNVADATEVKQAMTDYGFTEEKNNPDIVIINSCAIRETAEERIYGRLTHYKQLKLHKPLTLVLMGCLAQKDKAAVLSRIPQVDMVIGTHQKYHLPKILQQYLESSSAKTRVYDQLLGYQFNQSTRSDKFPFKADITIIHGCNKMCSYCIVPFTRGKEISRTSKSIIQNVTHLVNEGVSEILLLGQNVNSYGQDSHDISFAELLLKLNQIEGLRRIRFLTSHPIDFDMNLIDVIAESKSVCKYIHLPLQSASNEILQKMNREYTYEHYLHIINTIRKKIPNAVLSTDLIVGFPGESETDFEKTFHALTEIRYDTAFMFQYSPRAGTPATQYPDQIPPEEKKRRLSLIIETQARIRKEINQSSLGRTEEILIEGPSKNNPNQMLGKTDGNKAVVIDALPSDQGKYINVTLTALQGNTFIGTAL